MWHFRNDGQSFVTDKSRHKPSFNPRNKNASSISIVSELFERLLDIDISSKRYNNHIQRKQNLLYNLKGNSKILEKGPDNDFAVFVWDREDYFQEAHKQL